MSLLRGTRPAARTRTRLVRPVAATVACAALLVTVPAGAAQAHHGFDDFDTGRLYYVSGTVSEVRWGEPHSYFAVTVDDDLPADTPDLPLPEQLQSPEDSGPIEVAPSYPGSRDRLDVVIAPPSFTGRWGLDSPLAEDERVEAVGYIGRTHDDEFRPVVFWYDEGTPVNQVLGSQLPARPLAVPYPEGGAPAESGDDSATAAGSGGPSPIVVWSVVGAALIAAAAGGTLYLRSRARRT